MAGLRLPILRVPRVYHLGEIDRRLKSLSSFEGSGLSVSVSPEAWSSITPLPDRGYELSLASASFADFLAIAGSQVWCRRVERWAIEGGLATRASRWAVDWYDEEYRIERRDLYETRLEAAEEAEALGAAPPRRIVCLIPTTRLYERIHMRPSNLEVADLNFLVPPYVEDHHPDVDGVWWELDYDPPTARAPVGVIFNARLPHWARRPMAMRDMSEYESLGQLLEDLEAERQGRETLYALR